MKTRAALRSQGVLAVGALAAAMAMSVAAPATAKGGEVGGYGNSFYLSNSFSTQADVEFSYGAPNDQVYVGDWNGDDVDTVASRRGSTFYVRDSNTTGPADRSFTYGRPGDTVLVGDWDGDGTDTLAVRRGAEYHIKNSLGGGPADAVIVYGRPGDTVLVGDWDGDGTDTLAVRRGAEYHVKNAMAGGPADTVAVYGRAADAVLVGDWDGDDTDTFAVRRDAQYFIANTVRPGPADTTVVFGRPTDTALVGDWDGNGSDTLGLRRGNLSGDTEEADYDRRMVDLINAERVEAGVAPLTYWDPLRAGALEHSQWMYANDLRGDIQHASAEDLRADTARARCQGYGENIFWSYGRDSDPSVALAAYMDSPGHRANILRPQFRFVATGTVIDGDTVYNTQRFSVNCS